MNRNKFLKYFFGISTPLVPLLNPINEAKTEETLLDSISPANDYYEHTSFNVG